MATKPSYVPRWSDVTVGATVEPTEGKKDGGFVPGEKPPAQFINWLFNTIYLWILWLQDLTNQALTWAALQTYQRGIVATQAVVNGRAIDATGNGTGTGVQGTGGSSGIGVTGIAGSTAGTGVFGQGGASSGTGVQGTGGAYGLSGTGFANGSGVLGQGSGTGLGVSGIGGSTGIGVTGQGGSTSGIGVQGTGGTGSTGVRGVGGSGGGVGVDAVGTSGAHGTTSTGQGAGAGIVATGGATGRGVLAQGGATSGTGLKAIGGGSGVGIECGAGNMIFTGTQPVKTADPGLDNYACATNVCKAWGSINVPLGVPAITDGYNVATAVITGTTQVTITMARAMASTGYAPAVSIAASNVGGNVVPQYVVSVTSTTVFVITFYSSPTVQQNITGINLAIFFNVFGRQ